MTQVEILNYKNALVEVEAVLNCLEEEAYNKIPKNIIKAIENNKNENYIFSYDENLDYDYWNLSAQAKAMLYNIYKDYIATEEERNFFKEKERIEKYKLEKEKNQDFNIDTIFKDKSNSNFYQQNNNSLVKVKKQNWITTIFNKIRRIFMG